MIHRFVHFEVRRDSLDEALTAIRSFVDEVGRKEGGTASYDSFQDDAEPTRFTHYVVFRTPAAEAYHRNTAWNKRFTETVGKLCVAPPMVVNARRVNE